MLWNTEAVYKPVDVETISAWEIECAHQSSIQDYPPRKSLENDEKNTIDVSGKRRKSEVLWKCIMEGVLWLRRHGRTMSKAATTGIVLLTKWQFHRGKCSGKCVCVVRSGRRTILTSTCIKPDLFIGWIELCRKSTWRSCVFSLNDMESLCLSNHDIFGFVFFRD